MAKVMRVFFIIGTSGSMAGCNKNIIIKAIANALQYADDGPAGEEPQKGEGHGN